MRKYEETHPWLDFTLDARSPEYTTWLLLGEAVSKIEHIAGVPLSPDAADRLHSVYLAKGVLATTAIEGNTLTEAEVQEHLAGRLELPPSRQYLGQEVDNIVAACNRIGRDVISGDCAPISSAEVREYNKLVLNGLPLQEDVKPGEFRRHSVVVGRYRAAPAQDCEYLLDKFCEWLSTFTHPKGLEQPYAILAAVAAHLYFVWIHPFGDGNGRTARLIEFRLLLQAGFPTPAAHLLSNFYNLTRTEYYRHLDRASKLGGKMSEFITYAVRGLVDQLREQLGVIRRLQWDAAWHNYVYKQFGKGSAAHLRRRRLVFELSKVTEHHGWVRVSDIPQLTPRLAREYATKTTKTLSRDLNTVEQMNLVRRVGQTVRANKELILAFLPARAQPGETSE
ncbi:MAG: Fic family protein [Planctomycetota bacterium]